MARIMLSFPQMKLQLTKTKTVEIDFSRLGGGRKALLDVTGVVLNEGDARGCPAVRLVHKKNGWHVVAAGFVPSPLESLPESWDEANKSQMAWSLPQAFQAPSAALAVNSAHAFTRQTTPDALTADLVQTAAKVSVPPPPRKLGVRRLEKKADAPAPKPADAAGEKDVDVKPGVPASSNGVRFVMQPLAENPFVIQAGLPEYQLAWLSHLLPEGRRPTAASIQTLPSALLASLCEQPEFNAAGGTAFAIYVMRNAVYLAGYKDGRLILFRSCPGVAGWEMLREGVKLRLGLDEEMVDDILDDALIDPRSAMEPFVRPVLQQLEISLDYLRSRHNLNIDKVFIMGMPSGARYWCQMSEEALHLPLIAPSVFDGLTLPAKDAELAALTPSKSQAFLAALGAARAAMEGNA